MGLRPKEDGPRRHVPCARWRPALASSVGASVSLLAMASAGAALQPAPQVNEVGTVTTVAGPTFCGGSATADPRSTEVRGLAVDGTGVLHVDTGRLEEGALVAVDGFGQVNVVRTGGAAAVAAGGLQINRLASDRAGGVFVVTGATILSLGAAGQRVIAGGEPLPRGDSGTDGDGGAAHAARFRAIRAITSDDKGNVYVADEIDPQRGSVRVRFINRGSAPITFYQATAQELTVSPGRIDTVVGSRDRRKGEDANLARQLPLSGRVVSLAVAGARLFVATSASSVDGGRAQVQLVNIGGEDLTAHGLLVKGGAVGLVAGEGRDRYGGDGGPAPQASLSVVPGMAADNDGNLYLADESNDRVRRVDSMGVITSFAGTGRPGPSGGFNGNARPAVQTRLNRPVDVKVGPQERVYIADHGNGQVRYVDTAGNVHAAPGNGAALSWTCQADGNVRPAGQQGDRPTSVAADAQGNAYFAIRGLAQVQRLAPDGTITTVASAERAGPCQAGAEVCANPAVAALLATNYLSAVATGTDGRLYTQEAASGRVRVANTGTRPLRAHGLTLAPGRSETLAGTEGAARPELLPTAGRLGSLATDNRGNVFIADVVGQIVRRVDPAGIVSTVVARPPAGCCTHPTGVTTDAAGNLYVSDLIPPRVWFVNLGPQPVTAHGQRVEPGATAPVAGSQSFGFGGDGGPALQAQFKDPRALAVDPKGNLYVADSEEHTVRRVGPAGVISKVVGTGAAGFNGDGLNADVTDLNNPSGLTIDRCGNLLIADGGNGRIRQFSLAPVCAVGPAAGDTGGKGWKIPVGLIAFGLPAVGVILVLRSRSERT